jgi:hypothetical protein
LRPFPRAAPSCTITAICVAYCGVYGGDNIALAIRLHAVGGEFIDVTTVVTHHGLAEPPFLRWMYMTLMSGPGPCHLSQASMPFATRHVFVIAMLPRSLVTFPFISALPYFPPLQQQILLLFPLISLFTSSPGRAPVTILQCSRVKHRAAKLKNCNGHRSRDDGAASIPKRYVPKRAQPSKARRCAP